MKYDSDLLQRIVNEINTTIKPSLNADGGDISVVSLEGNLLIVRLEGACSCCARAQETLKYGVEQTLKRTISNEIIVRAV